MSQKSSRSVKRKPVLRSNFHDNDDGSSSEDLERSLARIEEVAQSIPQTPGRSRSVALKLESQGLTRGRRSFAVHSIQRDSQEWAALLRPFVSDLCFRSVCSRKFTLQFQPYSCQAALLFVDLSGYSKITAAIAHQGAHVISHHVNAYLSRLLSIIREFGGDVLKFAGDAILVAWEGDEQELELNVQCAAQCANELQEKASHHPVEHLQFQIHCAISCGPLESEVFEAPQSFHMQRLFHYVGGECVREIGDLVDLAKAGETCVSRNCVTFLEDIGLYGSLPLGAKLLGRLERDETIYELMQLHLQNVRENRATRRDRFIEEEFIHPRVLGFLTHGGLSPTQIAQMRNLCVLFIAMTSKGSSTNWLMEVQEILDRNRCPIVQIIYDDKGVHIVAAVNLYETVPEASLVGLNACRGLARKRVGMAVGIALGPAFCGVTGSKDACRWDITGPSVVRAARLMQYATQRGLDFAVDQSLYDDPMAATRLQVLDPSVSLKGTDAPVVVYTLSDSSSFSAFRILSNEHGAVHNDKVQQIHNMTSVRHRSGVIITGIPLAGMMIVCQRVAGYSDIIPYMHLCEESAGFLQLGRTIATWFKYSEVVEVEELAKLVISDMESNCWSCAHDNCVKLVDLALENGCQACFVVHRVEEIDKFSLSLIRECIKSRDHETGVGSICFLCTHTPLYSSKSCIDLQHDLQRTEHSFTVPIVELNEAARSELRQLVLDVADVEVEERLLDAYAESSGSCAEYFLERLEAVQRISSSSWTNGVPALVETSQNLVLHIPPRLLTKNKDLKVTEIRDDLAMRFSQVYDDLPPVLQMMVKICTIATRRGFFKIPYRILWESMNDLISAGVEKMLFQQLTGELLDMGILKVVDSIDEHHNSMSSLNDDDSVHIVYSIQNPALADIAMDVCTPVQVRSIAKVLIDRLQPLRQSSFRVSLVIATLQTKTKEDPVAALGEFRHAYDAFKKESVQWTQGDIDKWSEIFDDETEILGDHKKEIFGLDFKPPIRDQPLIPSLLSSLRFYVAPVSLGPLGLSLSVISRNTFHEYGLFSKGSCPSLTLAETLQKDTSSACGRYMMQVSVLENFLNEFGVGAPQHEVEAEMQLISFLANPADSRDSVETKATLLLEEIISNVVEHRLQRLSRLVAKLRAEKTTPDGMKHAPKALRMAYKALQAPKSLMDAAQDALMILASQNWKPRDIPEYLPINHRQNVANIRDATLRRLQGSDLMTKRHQQSVEDLEAFLLVTPLLYDAADNGLC